MTDITRAAPEKRLKLNIDGKAVELFMSFGLLDETIKLFDEEHPVETAMLDNAKRREVLEHMLKPRGKDEKYGLKDFNFEDSEISDDDVKKIFAFVLDNVTDFFIGGAETATGVLERYGVKEISSEPSATGSPP